VALTIRMPVVSVTSSEPDPEASSLDLVSEGLRRRQTGQAAAVTRVHMAAGEAGSDTWLAPATLWFELEGAVTGWEVGTEHDVVVTPAPIEGTAE
jgi:hypothetical protein